MQHGGLLYRRQHQYQQHFTAHAITATADGSSCSGYPRCAVCGVRSMCTCPMLMSMIVLNDKRHARRGTFSLAGSGSWPTASATSGLGWWTAPGPTQILVDEQEANIKFQKNKKRRKNPKSVSGHPQCTQCTQLHSALSRSSPAQDSGSFFRFLSTVILAAGV
jgi:hypothetical protein